MTSSVEIFVRFTHTGFHHWKDAPDSRAYLRDRHRHVFHFEAAMSVLHNDREVEFHDMLDECKMFATTHSASWQLAGASCEHMALALAEHLIERYDRPARVEVSEDGENGARVSCV